MNNLFFSILQAVPKSGDGWPIVFLLIALAAGALLSIILMKKNEQDKQRPNVDSEEKMEKPLYTSFSVLEDGTIVRGHNAALPANPSTGSKINSNEQKEALSLIQEAANEGVAEAQCYLGLCYEQGKVVPKDLDIARKWYRLASEQGFPQAKFRLGKLMIKEKQTN